MRILIFIAQNIKFFIIFVILFTLFLMKEIIYFSLFHLLFSKKRILFNLLIFFNIKLI